MERLSELSGTSVTISNNDAYPEEGQAAVTMTFSNGVRLDLNYWRLIVPGTRRLSSFDHEQKYGLPAPINAKQEIQKQLNSKKVTIATLDKKSGDLIFTFNNDTELQIFNFTGYEIWTMYWPDGRVQYSNYV